MATLEQPYVIRGPLTHEIADISSPVRQFLGSRFASGLRDVQRRYRENAPALIVPTAAKTEANPGTVGTAADWLLRFLLYPQPSIHLALQGAAICGRVGAHSLAEAASTAAPMLRAAAGIGHSLGLDRVQHLTGMTARTFTGPASASDAEPEYLARCCWVLALLTEVFRGGPVVAARGPSPSCAAVLSPPARCSRCAHRPASASSHGCVRSSKPRSSPASPDSAACGRSGRHSPGQR